MGPSPPVTKWRHLRKPLKLLNFILVLFSAPEDAVCASDSDKSALLELKASLSDPYGVLSSWNSQSPGHCSWAGLSCDSGSRVVAVNVTGGGNSLSCARIAQFPLYGFGIRRPCMGKVKILGKLSAAIAKLSELKILSLPFNELSGEIPVEIWGMEKLEVLDLEGNLISGSLPSQFSGLRSLRVLNLGFNEISGGIPNSLANCVGLQIVNLARNQVNGPIPRFIGEFRDLRGLYLSYNLLSGLIPVEIGENCGKLEHLDLSGNYLTEGIPETIGNCRRLKTLLLYSNLLEDEIPSELGQLSELEVLDISRNSFSGAVPSELGNCTKLSILVLSNLWDPLPNVSSLGGGYSPEKLAYTTDYNFYEGTIPVGVTSLSNLRMLWAPRAFLRGDVPANWGSCSNLEVLNLAQNFLSGKIPEGLSSCKKLHFLDLSSNELSGKIIDEIPVPCMTLFDVSGNSLSGFIPKFEYEACAPIQSVNGDSSYAYDPTQAYVTYFGYRNQIETALPFHRDGAGLLVMHNFGSNNLSGPLQTMPVASVRLGKQTVYAFLAGGNNFTGSFLGAFSEKCAQAGGIIVNVTNNGLFGQVPTDIAELCQTLMVLDVSRNQIAGSLPPAIGDMASLRVLDVSRNLLQGSIPSSLSRIKDLEFLSLSANKIGGLIPASLGQLHSLEVIDLSSNMLSGAIPDVLEKLRNLTVLLLNNNKLSGQLPLGLSSITSLSVFNVSFNDLSGSLPLLNDVIKCDSFVGNPSLHCSPSSPSTDQRQDMANDGAASPPSPSRKRGMGSLHSIEFASITSASAIVSVLIALIVLFFYTRKCKWRSGVSGTVRKEVIVFKDIGVPLTYENLVRGTGGFNVNNCIDISGFGATYKAEIAPGVLVAIKRLTIGRFQGVQQFDAEIKTLARLRHPNIVTMNQSFESFK